MAFLPLYALGFMGMTRRLSQDLNPEYFPLLAVAAAGTAVIALGVACQFIQIYVSVRDREQNRDLTGDPWGGRTFEWATSSPPPFYNFAHLPKGDVLDAFWYQKQSGEFDPTKEVEYERIHMPKEHTNRYLCFCMGIGIWLCDDLVHLVASSSKLCWHHRDVYPTQLQRRRGLLR